MRLDRFLSLMGVGPRSFVKHLVRKGRVEVNGEVVRKSSHKLQVGDKIKVLMKSGEIKEFTYSGDKKLILLLYKPAGYECSRKPKNHPSVYELIEDTNISHRLEIAGRLDVNAEGLVVLTDDGELIHRINRGKGKYLKTYEVLLEEDVPEEMVRESFIKGVNSRGEILRAESVEKMEQKRFRLVLSQGRFHQIKRMFSAVGAKVVSLRRISIGDYTLNGLKPGQYRIIYEDKLRIRD